MKKNSIYLLILASIFLGFNQGYAQNNKGKPEFSIMFYNVENLFDTIDDKTKNDNEYLPKSAKKWNTYKYYSKLKHITQVITAAGQWHQPDIVGFCEIENESCMWALTHNTSLSRLQYNFIHFDSPDQRGIDVAMLYNPKTFTPITKQPISIIFPNAPAKTRDILYVTGVIQITKDTLHVFVCHLPSRMGGQSKSEPKRIFAAQILKKTIDSIQTINNNAHIVIIGDFNDSPLNTSIKIILNASTEKQNCNTCLTNVIDKTAKGTHKFRGNWDYLDQSIVSNSLFDTYFVLNSVINQDFLLELEPKSGEYKPFRTYAGSHYHGGYSDHLPIILELIKK